MKEDRTKFLYGAAIENFRKATILLVGLGGVGLYALEALTRAGAHRFILVDGDTFEESNLNRQLLALPETIGKPKPEVAAARVKKIHPEAEVFPHNFFITEENVKEILNPRPDFIIDAIDDAPAKAALAKAALSENIPIIICAGTARRKDPTKIKITKLEKTKDCPLAKKVRKLLKYTKGAKKIPTVISEELPAPVMGGQPLPSASTVPAVAGLTAASFVINQLTKI